MRRRTARVLRRFAKFAKKPPTPMRYPIKVGKMGNKPHKKQHSKVANMSFENILENRERRRPQRYS